MNIKSTKNKITFEFPKYKSPGDFLKNAPEKEKKALFLKAAKQANKDQRKTMETNIKEIIDTAYDFEPIKTNNLEDFDTFLFDNEIHFVNPVPNDDKNLIKTYILNREKSLLADIENKVNKYLLENHDHYGDVPFKKGDPYIQSMDFERFLLKITQ